MTEDDPPDEEYAPDPEMQVLMKELDARRDYCEGVAEHATTAGLLLLLSDDARAPARCGNIGFIRSLHYTIVGSLDARDIPVTSKNIQTALELCFDEHRAAAMLDPNKAGTDLSQYKTPAAETFLTPEIDPQDENALYMNRLRQQLALRQNIKEAISKGLRHVIPGTESDPPEIVIDKVKDRFTACLREQLEAAYPGITNDKQHPLWKDPVTAAYVLGGYNIRENLEQGLSSKIARLANGKPTASTPATP